MRPRGVPCVVAGALLLVAGCTSSSGSSVRPSTQPTTVSQPRQASWSDAILYFVILDRFADGDPTTNVEVDVSAKGHFHGGDLTGLLAHLDEIADLGVTALWITPVVRNIDGFVTGAGFPDAAYHGYWADDFERLDPRFGTENELRELVSACHARGIEVLLDVVYNHSGYASRYATEARYRDWVRVAGECGDDDLTMCVAGLPDFRTEKPEVADFLMDAHIRLASRVGLDGFRLDTVKHVSHEFWQAHRARTRAELGQDFFLLGEVWGGSPDVLDGYFKNDELDAGFDFTFAGSVIGWLQGRGRTVAFNRYLERRHRIRDGYLLAHFLSSHDVENAPSRLGGDWRRYRLAVALQLTTVGIPVLYYGEEVGRLGGDWPDNRSDYPWNGLAVDPGRGVPRDESLRAWVTHLVEIRRAHRALSRGTFAGLATDGDLLVFARSLTGEAGETVIVAVNRGDQPAIATVDRPEDWAGDRVYDEIKATDLEGTGDGRLVFEVEPLGVRILTVR